MFDGSFRLIGPGLALILLVTVSACGDGGDKPRTLPPVSQTPISSSITPTPTGPTAAGAEAFIRDYYEKLNLAANTGETATLASMQHQGCPCKRVLTFIQKKYAAGRLDGAKYTLLKVGPTHVDGKTAAVQLKYALSSIRELDASGRVVKIEPAIPPTDAVASVGWTDGKWLLLNDQDLK